MKTSLTVSILVAALSTAAVAQPNVNSVTNPNGTVTTYNTPISAMSARKNKVATDTDASTDKTDATADKKPTATTAPAITTPKLRSDSATGMRSDNALLKKPTK